MNTVFWSALPFVVVFAGIYAAHRLAPVSAVREDTTGRRPSDPQLGAAGTGVERGPLRDADADLAALPRSPQTPAAAGDPRRPAVAGLQRKTVVLNG